MKKGGIRSISEQDGRKLVYILTIVAVLIVAVLIFYFVSKKPIPSPEDNIMFHLKFDEGTGNKVYDSSGFGSNGTISAAQNVQFIRAARNYALNFTTGYGKVSVENSQNLNFGDGSFSISLWIKPMDLKEKTVIVDKASSANSGYRLSMSNNGARRLELIKGYDYGQGAESGYILTAGVWQHIVVVYDSVTPKVVKFYRDGTLNSTGTKDALATHSASSTYALVLGGYSTSAGSPSYPGLRGWVDEVKIWDKALTLEEVQREHKDPPYVSISSPTGGVYGTRQILFNASMSSDATSMWFFNGTANKTYTGPETLTLADGSYTLYAYANNSFGSVRQSQVDITVDSTSLQLTQVSPLDNGLYGTRTVFFNVSSNRDLADCNISYTNIDKASSGVSQLTIASDKRAASTTVTFADEGRISGKFDCLAVDGTRDDENFNFEINISKYQCKDSDNGQNFTFKGTATFNSTSVEDFCKDSFVVNESYCSSVESISTVLHTCENNGLCDNGYCLFVGDGVCSSTGNKQKTINKGATASVSVFGETHSIYLEDTISGTEAKVKIDEGSSYDVSELGSYSINGLDFFVYNIVHPASTGQPQYIVINYEVETCWNSVDCDGGVCPRCGNNTIEDGEDCDGNSNLNGETCVSLDSGFTGGNLLCNPDCTFDTSSCTSPPLCPNGIVDADEDCDGNELDDNTCESLGFASGTLDCYDDCTFNTSSCVPFPPSAFVISSVIADDSKLNYREVNFRVLSNQDLTECKMSVNQAANLSMTLINSTYANYTFSFNSDGNKNVAFSCKNTSNILKVLIIDLLIDTVSPEVRLVSPKDNVNFTAGSVITFKFNVSDTYNIASCKLIVNDDEKDSVSSPSKNVNVSLEWDSPEYARTYSWFVECKDEAGNENQSEERDFGLNCASGKERCSDGRCLASCDSDDDDGGGGGGGGTGCTATCASLGYQCGTRLVCGSYINCGSCSSGFACNSTGKCVSTGSGGCTATCASLGFECGTQTICGASTNCGNCESGETCNLNGVCEEIAEEDDDGGMFWLIMTFLLVPIAILIVVILIIVIRERKKKEVKKPMPPRNSQQFNPNNSNNFQPRAPF